MLTFLRYRNGPIGELRSGGTVETGDLATPWWPLLTTEKKFTEGPHGATHTSKGDDYKQLRIQKIAMMGDELRY